MKRKFTSAIDLGEVVVYNSSTCFVYAVRFTKSKVFYDLTDHDGQLIRDVDSCDVEVGKEG